MIEKRVLKTGTSYRVRWRGPDGREQSKSFRTRKAATAFDAQRRAAGEAWVSPAAQRLTLDGVAHRFFGAQLHLKPRTRQAYGQVYASRIAPAFGRWPVGRIDRAAVQEWVNSLSEQVSPATVRNVHRVLSLILADAVAHGNLATNAAALVRLPRVPRFEAHPLTVEQVEALAADIRRRNTDGADLVVALAYTGLRWGEAVGLRVGDVDLARHRLRVVRTVSDVRGRLAFGTPKTHQSRTVPLLSRAEEIIERRCSGRAGGDPVFTTAAGSLWRSSNFRSQVGWNAATLRVTGREGVRVHDLRHTAASILIESGASVVDVAAVLGHATPTTTLNVYAHVLGDRLDAVRALGNERITALCGQNVATEQGH